MIRLLLVDDDDAQLRAMSRAFTALLDDLTVVTAHGGGEAIELLTDHHFDAVLTDLKMPGVNGFELLGWLRSSMPNLPVFTMTAHWNVEAGQRLQELGNLACFIKPISPGKVLERLRAEVGGTVGGHVENFSLASFLQLVAMERKTCTLIVERGERRGHLYLRNGELLDAMCDELRGEAAALAIAIWPSPKIAILPHCKVNDRAIHNPLGYIIMEAIRLKDEHDAERTGWANDVIAIPSTPAPPSGVAHGPSSGGSLFPRNGAANHEDMSASPVLATVGLERFEGALAVAIADRDGHTLTSAQARDVQLPAWVTLAGKLLDDEHRAVRGVPADQSVDEVVLSTGEICLLLRPIPVLAGYFVLLAFDPRESSFMRRRLEVQRFVADLSASAGENTSVISPKSVA